jgi:hypothetical protein
MALASALLIVGGLAAIPITSGWMRLAILAAGVGGGLWGLGVAWLLSRRDGQDSRT